MTRTRLETWTVPVMIFLWKEMAANDARVGVWTDGGNAATSGRPSFVAHFFLSPSLHRDAAIFGSCGPPPSELELRIKISLCWGRRGCLTCQQPYLALNFRFSSTYASSSLHYSSLTFYLLWFLSKFGGLEWKFQGRGKGIGSSRSWKSEC